MVDKSDTLLLSVSCPQTGRLRSENCEKRDGQRTALVRFIHARNFMYLSRRQGTATGGGPFLRVLSPDRTPRPANFSNPVKPDSDKIATATNEVLRSILPQSP